MSIKLEKSLFKEKPVNITNFIEVLGQSRNIKSFIIRENLRLLSKLQKQNNERIYIEEDKEFIYLYGLYIDSNGLIVQKKPAEKKKRKESPKSKSISKDLLNRICA